MVKDQNGELHTYMELLSKRINEVQINPNATSELEKTLDILTESLEKTAEWQKMNHLRDAIMNNIEQLLSSDKQIYTRKLTDCLLEFLFLYKEYFFKAGYYYGIKSKEDKSL